MHLDRQNKVQAREIVKTGSIIAGLGLAGGAAVLAGLALKERRRRQPVSGAILVVGDSLAVGTGQSLEQLHDADVITRAQVGESVFATRDRMAERLEGVPASYTIVLSTGGNSVGGLDATELAAEVSAMIRTLRQLGYRVILLGLPPARLWGDRRRSEEWNEELWRLNTIYSRMLDYVDTWAIVGDTANAGYYLDEFGAPDGLHPNRAGYNELAYSILEGE